jgi:two-component system, OmpR family, sensor histidine kinase MtrB
MKVKTAASLFAAIIFGLFLLLGISLIRITNLLEHEAKDLAMAGESIQVATELRSYLLIHNRNTFLYSSGQESNRLSTDSNTLRMDITDFMTRMEQLFNNEEEKPVLAMLEKEIAAYLEKRNQLQTSGLSAAEHYRGTSKSMDKILTVVDKLIEVNQAQMNVLMENIDKQNKMADKIAFLLLTMGGIVLLSLMGMMFLYIARPLRSIAATISKFSSGEAPARVIPRGLMEIRQIGSNFNSMADRLEEKQKEQLRFIAAIGHDLRNPLSSMSMASELLVRKNNPEDRELAAIISRQVKNLDRMVGDLLDTTRIEAGHLDLQCSSHNISSLIMDSIQLYRTGSELHRFNIDVPDELLFCECDGGRISQVINNLISNAIKYSPNGGAVTVRARRRGDEIVISVTDQGIGIAPEDLDNIFKPFHRTKATRGTIPGIGLGLSASRHIIEAHGGKLRVESKLGTGSTFYFSLPQKMRVGDSMAGSDHAKRDT